MFSSKFCFDTKKNYTRDKFFFEIINFFSLLKIMFKVSSQYLFNVFILFDIVFNLKLLKIDPKMLIFKNLEEIWKT